MSLDLKLKDVANVNNYINLFFYHILQPINKGSNLNKIGSKYQKFDQFIEMVNTETNP